MWLKCIVNHGVNFVFGGKRHRFDPEEIKYIPGFVKGMHNTVVKTLEAFEVPGTPENIEYEKEERLRRKMEELERQKKLVAYHTKLRKKLKELKIL